MHVFPFLLLWNCKLFSRKEEQSYPTMAEIFRFTMYPIFLKSCTLVHFVPVSSPHCGTDIHSQYSFRLVHIPTQQPLSVVLNKPWTKQGLHKEILPAPNMFIVGVPFACIPFKTSVHYVTNYHPWSKKHCSISLYFTFSVTVGPFEIYLGVGGGVYMGGAVFLLLLFLLLI